MALRHIVGAAAVAAVASFGLARAVYSQDANGSGAKPSDEELRKFFTERAALVEEHKKLASFVGTWDAEVVCTAADGTTKKSKGTVTNESVLGGRAILSRFKGDMNGMPFEGIELRGFDKDKKQHWSVWTDSMGTSYMRSTGTGSGADVTFTSDPWDMMGKTYTSTIVTKTVDPSTYTMEMVNTTPGAPEERSVITFKRRSDVNPR